MSKLKESEHLKVTFRDIEKATNNFETCIGKGGYGWVYKGELFIFGKLTTVAVKRLYEQFGQGSKEFLTEIALLSGQTHPNLISLLGYCEEGTEKIIVYEYAERGSLDQYLKHSNTTYTLTWLERLKICVHIARGIDHLHNHVGKHQTIIHRDIKSANVLLDRNWVAKISDLGLSKLSLAGLNRSAVISHACGTPRYCEPEYISSGIVTKESDVYSFGVVLLEILCGRLCTVRDDDGFFLLDYYKTNNIDKIVDPSLRKQMNSYSMNRFLAIVQGCMHEDRGQRYPMDLVVEELDKSLQNELSLINDDGRKSTGRRPNSSFNMLVRRRTNVGKIFDIFDINRDGGLSRKELAAFLVVTKSSTKHGEAKISTCDEVFSLYDKYIDGNKGLTYHGLLEYYDRGHGDLDYDITRLVSDSYSDDDDKSRRENLMTILHKLDGGHGFAYGDMMMWDLDFQEHGLDVNDDRVLWFGSPESLVITRPLTNRPMLLWFVVILLMLLMTIVLVKLSFMWFVYLILLNFIKAFKNKGKNMMS